MLGVTVCVNYEETLGAALPYWLGGLERCVIVTDESDRAAADLLVSSQVELFRTNVFYRGGAAFNKGGALADAFARLDLLNFGGWICLFDADIVPPALWWLALDELTPGNLYTAPRVQADTLRDAARADLDVIPEGPDGLAGYFLLFHTSDPRVPSPVFTGWQHAGNYDTVFSMRWPAQRYKCLPWRVVHIGKDRNWWGVGGGDRMGAMYRERERRGGDWQHERVELPEFCRFRRPAGADRRQLGRPTG